MTSTQADVVVPPGSWAWDPGEDDGGVVIDVPPGIDTPYATRWARPGTHLAARVALWCAVALGCVGGIAGLVRAPAAPTGVPVAANVDVELPAPVAGTAERAVVAWLTADGETDAAALADLFVEVPTMPLLGGDALAIGDATTILGREVGDGYWWVTVAVDVTEALPVASDETGAPLADEGESRTTTWYVEVGIVGEVESGLAALRTPAVLPAAPALPERWQADDDGVALDAGDDQYVTVEGFLRALLVGEGDPSRYMAPGLSIDLPEEPLFADVDIARMSVSGEPDEDGVVRVAVEAEVETPAGARRSVTYAVSMAEREGRWEVVDLPGDPVVEVEPGTSGAPDTTATSVPSRTDTEDGNAGDGNTEDGGTEQPSDDAPPTTLDGADAVVD